MKYKKYHHSLFDYILLVGFYLIALGMGAAILLESRELSERLLRLGMWVVTAFFLLTFVHGTVKGIHQVKIRIPLVPMWATFFVSAGLFLAGWLLGRP